MEGWDCDEVFHCPEAVWWIEIPPRKSGQSNTSIKQAFERGPSHCDVIPLASYQANAEAILYEIHEVAAP